LTIFGSFGMGGGGGGGGIVTIESLGGHCQLGDSGVCRLSPNYIYPESCYKKDRSVLFLLF
jgi:hypothetical protein